MRSYSTAKMKDTSIVKGPSEQTHGSLEGLEARLIEFDRTSSVRAKRKQTSEGAHGSSRGWGVLST
jgi:hypothetical protein